MKREERKEREGRKKVNAGSYRSLLFNTRRQVHVAGGIGSEERKKEGEREGKGRKILRLQPPFVCPPTSSRPTD